MADQTFEIKLPDLPPLSSISRRPNRSRRIDENEKNITTTQNEQVDTTIKTESKTVFTVYSEEYTNNAYEVENKENDYSENNVTVKINKNNEIEEEKIFTHSKYENSKIIQKFDTFLGDHSSEEVVLKNSIILNSSEEDDVHKRFMVDAENTLNRLNLYDSSNNNSYLESISSRFNKPPSVKSSVSVFNANKQTNNNSRPLPPIASTDIDDNSKDLLPSPVTKRRPNMQLISRKKQEQTLTGATILPPRAESSASIFENNSFYNKPKFSNSSNRIKTSDLLEDLQLFHYTKPNTMLNQNSYREVSSGSNLTSLSSPLSGDVDYFISNNNNYLDFIQTNNYSSRISSATNVNTPTTTSNSNHNISNNYQFQSRVASSSHRSDNRTTSVSSYSGSKPLLQVPSVSIPTQPFHIELLSEKHLRECKNIASISEIYEWLLKIYFEWFSNYLFDKMVFFQVIQLLIEFNISTKYNELFNNENVDQIIESLLRQRAVKFEKGFSQEFLENNDENNGSFNNISFEEEELTIITPGLEISGILTNLTSCSCCERFVTDSNYKCYSFICSKYRLADSKTKGMGSTSEQNQTKIPKNDNNGTIGVWSEYWNLTEQDLINIPPLELKKQSFIFDLIILEERSINLANAATHIYGKNFQKQLLPNDLNFEENAFQIFDKMANLHKIYILDPLYAKLQTEGKFINSIGEVYLRWVSKATKIYLEYAECMGSVCEIINWEKAQPVSAFRDWIIQIEDTPEIKMSKLYHDVIFFGGFFKSLQNLPITLHSILKCTPEDHEDFEFIKIAYEEIIALNSAVDKLLGASLDRAHILRISRQLIVTKHFKTKFDSLSASQRKNLVNNEGSLDLSEKLELRLNEKQRKLLYQGELVKKRDVHLPSNVGGHTRVYLFLFDNFFLISERIVQKGQYVFKLLERPIPIDYLNLESKVGLSSLLEFKIRNIATNESFTFIANSTDNLMKWTDSISLMLQNFSTNKENALIFKLRCINDSFTYKEKDFSHNLSVPTANSALDDALKEVYKGDVYEDKPYSNNIDDDYYSGAYENFNTNTSSQTNQEKNFIANVTNAIPISFENKKYTLIVTTLGLYLKNNKSKRQNSSNTNSKLNDWKFVCKTGPLQKVELCPMIDFLIILNSKGYLYYISLQSLILSYYKNTTSNDLEEETSVVGILINDKVSNFDIAEDLESSLQICYERKNKIVCHIPEYDFFTNSIRAFKFHKSYKLNSSHLGIFHNNNNDKSNFAISFGDKYSATFFRESFLIAHSNKSFILYNTTFNNDGTKLPIFPDVLLEPSLPEDELAKANSLERLSKEKLLLNRVHEIIKHKVSPIKSFMVHGGKNILLIYNNTVVLMKNNGMVLNGIKDILMIDFNIKTCAMFGEYLILCGENLVQVYDLNQELLVERFMVDLTPIQIIKGKKMKIISSDNSNEIMLLMSHPLILGKQLVLELFKA